MIGKNWLVILLSKNSMQLVGLGDEKIQTLPIPGTVISNMEVVNKDALYTLITNWLNNRPHTGAEIIWILAPDICFEHVITSTEQALIDSETLQFLDSVPFEEVLSRVYKPLEWRLIIAVNKDLIMSAIQGFILHAYPTKAVVPGRVLQAEGVLTQEIAQNAVKHAAELGRESLVSAPSPVITAPVQPTNASAQESKPKSQLPLLLGVFGVLLVILVAALLISNR
jgi:hypothetical protein